MPGILPLELPVVSFTHHPNTYGGDQHGGLVLTGGVLPPAHRMVIDGRSAFNVLDHVSRSSGDGRPPLRLRRAVAMTVSPRTRSAKRSHALLLSELPAAVCDPEQQGRRRGVYVARAVRRPCTLARPTARPALRHSPFSIACGLTSCGVFRSSMGVGSSTPALVTRSTTAGTDRGAWGDHPPGGVAKGRHACVKRFLQKSQRGRTIVYLIGLVADPD